MNRIVGTNACESPQSTCPRLDHEDYLKCKTICKQIGHAEVVAVTLAGDKAAGSQAFLEGHTYICKDCLNVLIGASVYRVTIGKPPITKKQDHK